MSDNGFILMFEDLKFPADNIIKLITPENLEENVRKAIVNTELFRLKFRQVAARSFMILRNYKGHEIRVERQQMNADKLLRLALEIEELPVIKETFREILEDYMDLPHAYEFIENLYNGKVKYKIAPMLDVASPFSYNLITLGASDIVLMEDRKKLIQKLYNDLIKRLNGNN